MFNPKPAIKGIPLMEAGWIKKYNDAFVADSLTASPLNL